MRMNEEDVATKRFRMQLAFSKNSRAMPESDGFFFFFFFRVYFMIHMTYYINDDHDY